jgi:prophage regulatory protein
MIRMHIATQSDGGRKILRELEVKQRTGKSRAQRWRDIRNGLFPAPIELGRNSIGWFEDEIEEWLAARPRRTYGAAQAT